eukprot:CAMPEP_0113943632 /NCGR_PEP_ID=MMETSP1339-20121228/26938_1 /TAXON_ID=94617 /ORGANISM="Fibrocapsa japonica" /LENGTH=192 /DNA_ID=CAMNT_0000948567 /DNA_START=90 /DNA_END=668 /DNA_ORIENTATION=- /assembly_acc=CAM_ASM_000762
MKVLGIAMISTLGFGLVSAFNPFRILVNAKQYGGVAANISGSEELMSQKQHGTCVGPAQDDLRWGCSRDTADKISCFNRHYAEFAGYWETTDFLKEESDDSGEITFYDAITGKELFYAPRGRSFEEFVAESKSHGWPSFRDEELNTDNVRVLPNGETVSVDGTHLGHNLPDGKGNRYCINLACVAGRPLDGK